MADETGEYVNIPVCLEIPAEYSVMSFFFEMKFKSDTV
jgi:hypothetical protein